MKGFKEQVKAGELSAADALAILEAKAKGNGTIEAFVQTATYRWLKRRIKG